MAFADCLGVSAKADPVAIGLAISILRQVASPTLYQGTPRGIIDREFGEHCTHDRFYMHQVPLVYMLIFSQWPASKQLQRSADWAIPVPPEKRNTQTAYFDL